MLTEWGDLRFDEDKDSGFISLIPGVGTDESNLYTRRTEYVDGSATTVSDIRHTVLYGDVRFKKGGSKGLHLPTDGTAAVGSTGFPATRYRAMTGLVLEISSPSSVYNSDGVSSWSSYVEVDGGRVSIMFELRQAAWEPAALESRVTYVAYGHTHVDGWGPYSADNLAIAADGDGYYYGSGSNATNSTLTLFASGGKTGYLPFMPERMEIAQTTYDYRTHGMKSSYRVEARDPGIEPAPPGGGIRPLRKFQTLTGSPGGGRPLRKFQNGGHSGGRPLRKFATGI